VNPSEERSSGKSDSNSGIHSGVDRRAALRKPGSSEDKKLSLTLLRVEDSRTLPPAMSTRRWLCQRKSAPRIEADTKAR